MRLRSTALETPSRGAPLDGGSRHVARDGLDLVQRGEQPDAEIDAHRRVNDASTADAAYPHETNAINTAGIAPPHHPASLLLSRGDPRIDPRVVAAFETEGETPAGVRGLRGTLSSHWHGDSPEDRRAVALVGMDPSVDVATVAANLAVVSAQIGWRTLLVDGDLQAPAQSALFRVPADEGLSTLLHAPGTGRAALQPTAIDRLMLLPAGPPPSNPVELLERQPLLEALDGRIGRHRLLLLSLSTRAQSSRFGAIDAILNGFDGVILVANRHHSGLRPLQRLTDVLQERNVPVLATAVLP